MPSVRLVSSDTYIHFCRLDPFGQACMHLTFDVFDRHEMRFCLRLPKEADADLVLHVLRQPKLLSELLELDGREVLSSPLNSLAYVAHVTD